MNLKYFDKRITLFHYDGKKYSKNPFWNVSLVEKESIEVSTEGEKNTSTILVRIPVLDNKIPVVSKGDYIVVGIVKEEFELKKFLKKYKTYKIISITDNSNGGLAHIKVEGKR